MIVSEITIFPIKALAGISLGASVVTSKGFQYDRRFMLVDESHQFITQRTHPELTAFSLSLVNEVLTISHPAGGSVEISIHPPSSATINATIWGDTVRASRVSKEADDLFSDTLESLIHLVGMPDTSLRQIDPDYSNPGEGVSFADGFPILVLGTASLEELNGRLENPVPTNRFRANLLVSGGKPWAEDEWGAMHFGKATLNIAKPCARCVVIQTDQKTGERAAEPTKTLLTYRKIGSKVLVGMNAIPLPSAIGFQISVGDSFSISD